MPGVCFGAAALSLAGIDALPVAVLSLLDVVVPFAMPAPVEVVEVVESIGVAAPEVPLAMPGAPVSSVDGGTPPWLFMPAVPPAPFGVPAGTAVVVSFAVEPLASVLAF